MIVILENASIEHMGLFASVIGALPGYYIVKKIEEIDE